MKHWPCGYWYKRLFEDVEEYPVNCWIPSIAVYDGKVLFVGAGKWFPNQIIFLEHNLVSGTWETLHTVSAGLTPESVDTVVGSPWASGEAQYVAGFKGFYNRKADITGPVFQEASANFAMGLWLFRGTDAVTYQEFTDASPELTVDCQGKMALSAAGVVAIIYTLSATGETVVKVSTDWGATFTTVKTLAINAARLDYGLVIDGDGRITIAYQHSATQVSVEHTVDNGVVWTGPHTFTAGANITRLRLHRGTTRFLVAVKGDATNLYLSGAGSSWSLASYGSWAQDPTLFSAYNLATNGRELVRAVPPSFRKWDGSDWVLAKGEGITTLPGLTFSERLASMDNYTGHYVYSHYNLYYEATGKVALLHAPDGIGWNFISTPLEFFRSFGDMQIIVSPVWPFSHQVNKPKTSWDWSKI